MAKTTDDLINEIKQLKIDREEAINKAKNETEAEKLEKQAARQATCDRWIDARNILKKAIAEINTKLTSSIAELMLFPADVVHAEISLGTYHLCFTKNSEKLPRRILVMIDPVVPQKLIVQFNIENDKLLESRRFDLVNFSQTDADWIVRQSLMYSLDKSY